MDREMAQIKLCSNIALNNQIINISKFSLDFKIRNTEIVFYQLQNNVYTSSRRICEESNTVLCLRRVDSDSEGKIVEDYVADQALKYLNQFDRSQRFLIHLHKCPINSNGSIVTKPKIKSAELSEEQKSEFKWTISIRPTGPSRII